MLYKREYMWKGVKAATTTKKQSTCICVYQYPQRILYTMCMFSFISCLFFEFSTSFSSSSFSHTKQPKRSSLLFCSFHTLSKIYLLVNFARHIS